MKVYMDKPEAIELAKQFSIEDNKVYYVIHDVKTNSFYPSRVAMNKATGDKWVSVIFNGEIK